MSGIGDISLLALTMVAGVGLGTMYFGGLWMTLKGLSDSRRPAMLVFGSYFGRLALCVAGFFFIARAGWQTLIAALAGFILVRLVMVRRWGTGRSPDGNKP